MAGSRVTRCAVTLLIALSLVSCASRSDSTTSTSSVFVNGTVACGTNAAPPCVPVPTTRTIESSCGDITEEFLSRSLGRTVTAVTPVSANEAACAFTAGDLTLRFGISAYNPYESGTTLLGGSSAAPYRITNDRSGRWFAEGYLTVNGLNYQWGIVSGGQGSDTYPPAEGPEQRPIVTEAAAALVEGAKTLQPRN